MMSYFHCRLPLKKALEVGFQSVSDRRFDLYFRFNFRGHDHAGLKFFVSFLGTLFEFSIYDTRHWNHITDDWVKGLDDETLVGCSVDNHDE